MRWVCGLWCVVWGGVCGVWCMWCLASGKWCLWCVVGVCVVYVVCGVGVVWAACVVRGARRAAPPRRRVCRRAPRVAAARRGAPRRAAVTVTQTTCERERGLSHLVIHTIEDDRQ